MMLDFSNAVEQLNNYKGSEKKKTLVLDNKRYLVKFPDPIREKNKNISYINNAFSEYIGSNIFKLIGFETQNTILGKYIYNGKEKIVCACEDFTNENNMLYEFENLVLSANPDKKIETELSDILYVIDEIGGLNTMNLNDNIKEKFWDMFVVDSIIGNSDRHNGNWGLLVNVKSNEARFAPIYDCGSCLNPMLEDKELEKITGTEIKNLALNSYSCIKENNKKINYLSYMKHSVNKELDAALKRVIPNIDIDKIDKFIDEIECMNNCRKEFYKKIIHYRYDAIKSLMCCR